MVKLIFNNSVTFETTFGVVERVNNITGNLCISTNLSAIDYALDEVLKVLNNITSFIVENEEGTSDLSKYNHLFSIEHRITKNKNIITFILEKDSDQKPVEEVTEN